MTTFKTALVLFLLALATAAEAVTLTPTGATVDISYLEPSTNADGTPLADLHHCNVYLSRDGQPEVKMPDVAASSPQGGSSQTVPATVQVLPGETAVLTASATCTDTSANESVRSAVASITIDRLAPAPPQ